MGSSINLRHRASRVFYSILSSPWAYLAPFQRWTTISIEKCKFSYPCLLYAPPKGFPLELDIGARDRKLRWCSDRPDTETRWRNDLLWMAVAWSLVPSHSGLFAVKIRGVRAIVIEALCFTSWAGHGFLGGGTKQGSRAERAKKIFLYPPLFQMWGYKQANISRGLLNILKFAVWLSH